MRRVKLDRIDLRILKDLQDQGRITNVELARRAGISAPPCLRRVRALEEAGFIRAYHADLHPERLGYEVMFFALVGLDNQSESVLSTFENLMSSWPEVRECHMARGPHDFVLLSSVVHAHVGDLFPGMEITDCYQFRVTRNSDL